MQIRSHRTRISGTDHLRRTNSNGRRKIGWYQGVASANNCEASSLIPRICKFLQKIYWSLRRNSKTNKRVNTKRQAFRLDSRMPTSFRIIEGEVSRGASTKNDRSNKTI